MINVVGYAVFGVGMVDTNVRKEKGLRAENELN